MAKEFEPRVQSNVGSERSTKRLARLEQAICDQRRWLCRVPDPDTRERAEVHLYRLISMREHLQRALAVAY